MSDWTPYIALLGTINEVLTDAHLRQDWDVLLYEDEWERGQVMRAHVTIPNPGDTLYAANAPQYVAIMESADGTIANARIHLRGTIVPAIRSGIDNTASTVVVDVEAAPRNVKNLIFDFALSTVMVRPYWDEVMDDLDFDAPEKALVGRSATYFVDPVTHAVSLEDIIDSTLPVIDIEDQSDFTTHRRSTVQPPVARAVMTVSAEWEQFCKVAVNVAGRIAGYAGNLATLDAAHFENQGERQDAGKYLNFAMGGGWTTDRTQAVGVQYKSNAIYTARGWQTTVQYGTPSVVVAQRDPITGELIPPTLPDGYTSTYDPITNEYSLRPPQSDVKLDEFGRLWVTEYRWNYYWMVAEYRQQRRETLTMYMDMPIQTTLGFNARLDCSNVSLKDLLTWDIMNPEPPPPPDPNGDYAFPYSATIQIKPHDDGTIYMAGDVCSYAGYGYECTADDTVGYLYVSPTIPGNLVVNGSASAMQTLLTPQLAAGWRQIPWGGPIQDSKQPSFLDTPRGMQVIEHVGMRLRAALRSRVQAQTFAFGTDWETGWAIDGRCIVRATYWDWQAQAGKTVEGKVRQRKRQIQGERAPYKWVDLTIGLCVGTGESQILKQAGPKAYDLTTVSIGDWLQTYQQRTASEDNLVSVYNFEQGYPLDKLGTYAVDDIAWTYGAQPLDLPVDAYQLGNAGYAVVSVARHNMAGDQLSQASLYGMVGRDPRDAIRDHPTRLDVVMRDLNPAGVLERDYHAVGQLAVSPKGVDLTGEGQ